MKIKEFKKINVGNVEKEFPEEIFNQLLAFQGYGFNKCLDPYSTYVESKYRGVISLDEVLPGEYIKAPGESGNDVYVEITDKFYSKVELFEIELDNKKIICSMKHKFKCNDNKVHELWEIIEKDLKILTE